MAADAFGARVKSSSALIYRGRVFAFYRTKNASTLSANLP